MRRFDGEDASIGEDSPVTSLLPVILAYAFIAAKHRLRIVAERVGFIGRINWSGSRDGRHCAGGSVLAAERDR
jgi:hypothetical protein